VQAKIDGLVETLEALRGEIEQAEADTEAAARREEDLRGQLAAAKAAAAAARAEAEVVRASVVGSQAQRVLQKLKRVQRQWVRFIARSFSQVVQSRIILAFSLW
jgi:chromosome segregation ATPase